MERLKKPGKYFLVLVLVVLCSFFALTRLLGPRIGNTFSPISNCLPPGDPFCGATPTLVAFSPTEFSDSTEESSSSSVQDQLARIDQVLDQSVQSSIAYNVPSSAPLNQAVTLELLLNPSVSPTELAGQIIEQGEVTTATIEITPLMKAELIPKDAGALTIQPIHTDAVQPVGSVDTTRWAWLVTGRKGGPQKLLLVIHRLIEFDGQEYWREVKTYESELNVQVSFAQRLQSPGWLWIVPLLLIALVVPFLWRQVVRGRSPLGSKESLKGAGRSGHIFISYRRADSADITGRIYDRLVDEFGRSVIFKDVDSIPLGADFKEYLDRKVSECKVLLAVIGDRWLELSAGTGKKRLEDPQDFVRVEVESALERGIVVIPLLVRGANLPEADSLPPGLRKLVYQNGIQIRPDPDFHRDMDRLVAALDQYLRSGV